MRKPTAFVLMGAIALMAGCATPIAVPQGDRSTLETSTEAAAPLSNAPYSDVLQTYVDDDGLVDYVALQANPEPLNEYVAMLGAVSPSIYEIWNDQEKIAFLINAYNAITLQSIIAQDPLRDSIRDIFGVWNFNKHTVMGQAMTLDTLEHEILRKDFQEPRIHAALVCAAISCPPLRREPYTGAELDAQLTNQVEQWLSGPHGLKIDRTQNQVSISAIFDWFGEDWQPQYGIDNAFTGNEKERAVLNFISNYVSAEEQDYLRQGNYKLNYLNYDWSLNRQ